jgi:hypothetical protein
MQGDARQQHQQARKSGAEACRKEQIAGAADRDAP